MLTTHSRPAAAYHLGTAKDSIGGKEGSGREGCLHLRLVFAFILDPDERAHAPDDGAVFAVIPVARVEEKAGGHVPNGVLVELQVGSGWRGVADHTADRGVAVAVVDDDEPAFRRAT